MTRNYVVKNDAILYRQKQYKILAPKTTESFGAKNYTNGFRCCDLTKKFGAKTTENCGAKNYTICFRCCDLTEKIWCLTNSQFFVHIHPLFTLNHLVLKPVFLIFRGKGCEAFIRISQPFTSLNDRRRGQEDTEEVELICSPATRRIYDGQGR